MRLKTILWTSLIPIIVVSGTFSAQADVSVASWGGVYTKSQQKAFGETWEKRAGKSVRWIDYNGGLGEIRAQVNSGKVLWDVVDVFPDQARVGCDEGLFETLPRDRFTAAPDGTPMDQDLVVPRPNDCVVPNVFWSWLVFFDETKFPDAKPRTIEDFFDLKKFPGKRSIGAFAQANIEMALVADGVSPNDIYKVMDTKTGIDRAFAKLDTIKNDVLFWSSAGKPIDYVNEGAVVMATAYNGRVSDAIIVDGAPLKIIWDGQVLEEEWFVMVKGTENYDDALDFLIHASATKQLAALAKWITYGPLRRSSLAVIRANEPWHSTGVPIMPHMPNRAEVMKRTIIANPDWWAENGARIGERYKNWMAR